MRTLVGRRSWAGALLAACALAVSAYAFTASNTVPGSNAGTGAGTISGYTVSNVAYVLNSGGDIDRVTFTLSASATTAKAKLTSGGSTYTACSITSGTSVDCDFSPDVSILSANELTVVAST